VGETENNNSWNYQQLQEHPEYLLRLQTILEDKLQTKITLSIKTRAYTEDERLIEAKKKMTPFELDLQKEPALAELQKIFAAELVYSVQMKKTVAPAGDIIDPNNDN
jgi:hypothetical protein